TVGNESLHEISNYNGVRVVNFAISKNLTVKSTMAADCDTDHYLVVAKVRERLAVSKQTTHTVHMERFHLKKLNEVEGEEQYRVEISNRFAALENLDTEADVNQTF
ncbi:hypothetical protein B7P43_G17043, partial [Cryptotermes secundus]